MRTTTGWKQLIGLSALMLLASAATLAGEMYRWVDADGRVHYSDQAPPADAKDVKSMRNTGVDSAASSSDSDDESEVPSYVEQQAAFEERQAKRAEQQAKAEEEKKLAAERKKNCEAARGNYNTVTTGGRVMRVNAQGEREYLSDEEIQKETIEARKSVEELCKGVD